MTASGNVKSAERVMAVLELFAERQAPASVLEVSRELNLPQSSTSMLLATLERLGYLSIDSDDGGFRPTLRVMLLGHWLHDWLFGEGTLVSAVDELRRRTGETVLIGIRQGLYVRSILALRGTRPGAMRIRPGVLYPLAMSSMGKIFLTLDSDSEVRRSAEATNLLPNLKSAPIDANALVAEVRACRVHGWSESDDWPLSGRGAIATLLPRVASQPQMAIAMGMNMSELLHNRNGLLEELMGVVQRLRAAPGDS